MTNPENLLNQPEAVLTNPSLRETSYYPWLDVLRAVSVLFVFINHFGNSYRCWHMPWLSRGGVSIFFAISGFLITKILLENTTRERFLTWFYARRFLRIYPAYLLTIFLFFLYSLHPFGRFTTSYFQALPLLTFNYPILPYHINLFSHAWSICTEERFYLLWPVMFLTAKRLKISPWLVLGILFFSSNLIKIPFEIDHFVTPLLPASLLYGCGFALWFQNKIPPKGVKPLISGGISMIIFLFLSYWLHNAYHPAASLFLIPVIWGFSTRFAPPGMFNPFLSLGKWSYEIYLLHMFPIFLSLYVQNQLISANLLIDSGFLQWLPFFIFALGCTIGLSYAVYRFIDKPFLTFRKHLPNYPLAEKTLAITQVFIIPAGILIWWLSL